jgi:PAS domain-containing protein
VEAPAAMALLSGPDHRFVFANRAYFKMAGRRRNEIIGKLVRDALPELVDQGFLDLLNRVFAQVSIVIRSLFSSDQEQHL